MEKDGESGWTLPGQLAIGAIFAFAFYLDIYGIFHAYAHSGGGLALLSFFIPPVALFWGIEGLFFHS